MIYKSDLHCHTIDVSKCADLALEEMIENYIKYGYSTMVITDHFSSATFEDNDSLTWSEKCDFYVSGYKRAKKIADGRINVLLGMEYRNIYTANDYLVYGVTEEFLKKYNTSEDNNIINLHLKDFCSIVHENGMLIYQAHPFRNGMTVMKPGYTDGIETLNAHKGHDSRNDVAKLWAKKYNLLECGGSDCHHKGGEGRGGIITNTEITTNSELLNALKGEFSLISPED
jgi:predicted metal-dependent phosphoesterase TrpH